MKKFFKMKNLVKKIILILQKFFWKIVEKLKRKSFWKHSKSFKTPKFSKKNSHSSTYIYFEKKEKFSAWIWGNLHFLEGRFEKKKLISTKNCKPKQN